jgi:hypothetical protein
MTEKIEVTDIQLELGTKLAMSVMTEEIEVTVQQSEIDVNKVSSFSDHKRHRSYGLPIGAGNQISCVSDDRKDRINK